MLCCASFLDEVDRIATRDYEPSDDDVVKARLRTTGVQEYHFLFEKGTSPYPLIKLGHSDYNKVRRLQVVKRAGSGSCMMLGVRDHMYVLSCYVLFVHPSGWLMSGWLMDVMGGGFHQRSAWYPYFMDVNGTHLFFSRRVLSCFD